MEWNGSVSTKILPTDDAVVVVERIRHVSVCVDFNVSRKGPSTLKRSKDSNYSKDFESGGGVPLKLLQDKIVEGDGESRSRYRPKVYFIYDEWGGAVKIGVAGDPLRRLDQLQTGNPRRLVLLGTIPGGRGIEAEIHDHFRPAHLRMEWFRATDEVLVMIDSILQDGWPIP